jgi:hypothetical protein
MPFDLEVADVFLDGRDHFLSQYGRRHSAEQHRVFRAITRCRTAELGGQVQFCHDCGHQRIQYHSCRNRHCPKCQAMARAAWVDQRETELLPVPYFHVVFTLPQQLAPLALQNKRVLYGILFRAAAQTLQELAHDPKHLGANVGILMVLHTWGQNLMHHPHVHSVVTGGGISRDGSRWVSCRQTRAGKPFFIDVKILSRVFRGKFIGLLKQAFVKGELEFYGQLTEFAEAPTFEQLLNSAVKNDWIVHAKRPFGGPQQVLRYLARYTHRVAISNQRLLDLKDGQVRFQYKDYADEQRSKTMTLSSGEFIRRFLMHTLPSRFVRIRYFGILANRFRKQRLDECRSLLGVVPAVMVAVDDTNGPMAGSDPQAATSMCPKCGCGRILILELSSLHALRPPNFLTARRETSTVGRSPPHL